MLDQKLDNQKAHRLGVVVGFGGHVLWVLSCVAASSFWVCVCPRCGLVAWPRKLKCISPLDSSFERIAPPLDILVVIVTSS